MNNLILSLIIFYLIESYWKDKNFKIFTLILSILYYHIFFKFTFLEITFFMAFILPISYIINKIFQKIRITPKSLIVF